MNLESSAIAPTEKVVVISGDPVQPVYRPVSVPVIHLGAGSGADVGD